MRKFSLVNKFKLVFTRKSRDLSNMTVWTEPYLKITEIESTQIVIAKFSNVPRKCMQLLQIITEFFGLT